MADATALKSGDLIGGLGFGGFNFGAGTMGNILIAIVIVIVILSLVVGLVVLIVHKRRYNKKIPLYSLVGNKPTRIGVCKAREIPIGRAGDKLWFVKGKGIKKYIAPANIQSAPNEFWHWVRSDGEWINFSLANLDEQFKSANAHFINQDMRLTRLAIDRLLEQRLTKKTFMEQWGTVIGYIIFFLIITVCMVIFLYQYGKILDKEVVLINTVNELLKEARSQGGGKLIPATVQFLPLLFKLS